MELRKHKKIVASFAWTGADLQDSTEWIRPFRPGELK